jgi:hypothetical protein
MDQTVVQEAPKEKTYTGSIAVIDRTGDTKILWDKAKTVEVDNARESFKRLRKEGYLVYKVVGDKGDKGEMMTEFDPNEERYIAAPPLQGG